MQTIVTCPKCSGEMIPVRRSGVVIDRCSNCDGIYLDRGELDKLITMEQRVVSEWDDDDGRDEDYDEERGQGRRKKSRKRSFFEDLFDIG